MTISEIRCPAEDVAAPAPVQPPASQVAPSASEVAAPASQAASPTRQAAPPANQAASPTDAEAHAVESWRRREPPLPAVAVLGVGTVATALAAATHRLLTDGAALRTVADPEYLVVLGDETALPWVDGARYLGWDGAALTLTTHRVLPSADLWRSTALAARNADATPDTPAAEPPTLVIVLPEQVLIAANTITDADPTALAELFAAE